MKNLINDAEKANTILKSESSTKVVIWLKVYLRKKQPHTRQNKLFLNTTSVYFLLCTKNNTFKVQWTFSSLIIIHPLSVYSILLLYLISLINIKYTYGCKITIRSMFLYDSSQIFRVLYSLKNQSLIFLRTMPHYRIDLIFKL